MAEKTRNPLEISIFEFEDLADSGEFALNNSETCEESGTPLTQACSGSDLVVFEGTPESLGAMAALKAKADLQGATRFFDDPIHVRRDLIAKREAAGADTPYGHTCSNIIEQLENLFGSVRPAWATDERQTLPWLINQQVERLAHLSQKGG